MCLTGTPFANRYKNRFCIQKSFRISAERVLGIPFAAGKMLLLSVRHFTKTDSPLNLQSDQRKNGKLVLFCFPFFFICATCLHCCHSCGSQESDILDWNAFRQQVQEQILYTEVFPHICGTCSWYSICSRKEAAAISQAFYKNRFSLKFTIRSKKKRKASFILLSVFLLSC